MSTSPRNTSQDDPLIKLAVGLDPEGIYAQEAQGQREMVASTVLPTDYGYGNKSDFDAMGIVFGEPVEGDALFQQVTLPEGWKKQPTSHSMWSEVVDDRGIPVIEVFYKAAFYDRRAFMRPANVGNKVVVAFVYPEEGIAASRWLPLLTKAEREQAWETVRYYEKWAAEEDTSLAPVTVANIARVRTTLAEAWGTPEEG